MGVLSLLLQGVLYKLKFVLNSYNQTKYLETFFFNLQYKHCFNFSKPASKASLRPIQKKLNLKTDRPAESVKINQGTPHRANYVINLESQNRSCGLKPYTERGELRRQQKHFTASLSRGFHERDSCSHGGKSQVATKSVNNQSSKNVL